MTPSAATTQTRPQPTQTLKSSVRVAEASDVVMILGYTSWSGAVRRGWIHAEDRLTLYLMGSPRVRRLLVCNPYRSRPVRWARALAGQRDERFPATPTRTLLEPLRLRRHDPTEPAAIERSFAAYEREVRAAAERAGLERPAVITTHPLMAGWGSFDWAGPVTYYANDDLTACPPFRRWWSAFELAFERARAAGRRGVGLTPRALESIAPSGPGAVIPCGIEPEEWIVPELAPGWFESLPRPRFLYVGSLDARVEIEQVRAVAAAHPEGSITLVGPMLDAAHYEPLAGLPNVSVRPPVSRAELAGVVAAADVGLIPHVRTAQTEAMSPLKLYEYVAAGIPVAAPDLPGIAGVCPERTVLAGDGGDFGAAAARALALGRWPERERRAFIEANSWDRRFDDVLELALAR